MDEYGIGPAFEWLREEIPHIAPATPGGRRDVRWASDDQIVGVSRAEDGRIELFLVGPELIARVPVVRDALEYHVWSGQDGDALPANRMRLPAEPYFDSVAAFICAELLGNGFGSDRDRAFSATEPVIALALRRARASNAVLAGLAGELYLLAAMTQVVVPAQRGAMLDAWCGFERSTRDFQFHTVGVEVKTTTGTTSEHHIQGPYQVELGLAVGDVPETDLYLLSVGIQWLPIEDERGHSIATLVGTIGDLVVDHGTREEFYRNVQAYGGAATPGYNHTATVNSEVYSRRFLPVFERLYDTADPSLGLIRTADLEQFSSVVASSVSYKVTLSPEPSEHGSPILGIAAAAVHIASRAGNHLA